MTWSRGWSSAEAPEPKREWTPVMKPTTPVFESIEEKRRYEDALAACQREPGEDIVRWVERVIAAAQPTPPREPGMEG